MLDQQHGMRYREPPDERDHAGRLLGPHAGQRFVEQQYTRIRREGHRDFELALLAMTESSRSDSHSIG